MVAEVDEDLLHLFRCKLSMSDGNTCIRDFSLDKSCEILYVIDTAIDEVDLSISTHLKANRLSDDLWGHLCEDSLDGSTISWRGIEVGQISRSHERELEGARDRSRTHSEGVDIDLKLAKLLFNSYTELLLLVDDEKSQIMEGNILTCQAMGSDDDVDLSLLEIT